MALKVDLPGTEGLLSHSVAYLKHKVNFLITITGFVWVLKLHNYHRVLLIHTKHRNNIILFIYISVMSGILY